MTKFEITIDLVAEDGDLDAVPDYGNRQVSSYLDGTWAKWDITLSNTVEAETAEVAANTIRLDAELLQALNDIDPNWHAIIFQDDDEKIELLHGGMYKFDELGYREGDVDLSKDFKCRECGTKYEHSFCSTSDVSVCRWCAGEETEAGILE